MRASNRRAALAAADIARSARRATGVLSTSARRSAREAAVPDGHCRAEATLLAAPQSAERWPAPASTLISPTDLTHPSACPPVDRLGLSPLFTRTHGALRGKGIEPRTGTLSQQTSLGLGCVQRHRKLACRAAALEPGAPLPGWPAAWPRPGRRGRCGSVSCARGGMRTHVAER